ncbi:hypothetical protein KAR91_81265 [Candidatus Pacearchaeota archaeon]|nr:hypothetical protein [Candidatus Pacearchaeota archaeon]
MYKIMFFKIYGWIFVRPRRWLFWHMVWSDRLSWKIERNYYYDGRWKWPNLHWWILRQIIFEPLKWLYWDGWRIFEKWEDKGGGTRWPKGRLLARIAKRIGQTTAGCAISGGECFHCAFPGGDPLELSDPEGEYGEEYFELTDSGSTATMDGTDHWFRGITTCPRCGYKQEYGDSSL